MKRLLVVAGFTAILCHGQQRGSISGRIHADSGRVDGLVYLQWTREGLPPEGARQFGSAAVNSGGDFRLAELAPGAYRICVRAINQEFLDPCIWDQPLRFTVGGGESADISGLDVGLRRGVRLQLHFSDPGRLLAAPDNAGVSGALEAGLWLPSGAYVPMTLARSSPADRVLEAIVPPRSHIRIQFRTAGVRVLQKANTPEADRIPYLDNPAGFAVFSGEPGRPTVFRFEVLRPAQ